MLGGTEEVRINTALRDIATFILRMHHKAYTTGPDPGRNRNCKFVSSCSIWFSSDNDVYERSLRFGLHGFCNVSFVSRSCRTRKHTVIAKVIKHMCSYEAVASPTTISTWQSSSSSFGCDHRFLETFRSTASESLQSLSFCEREQDTIPRLTKHFEVCGQSGTHEVRESHSLKA